MIASPNTDILAGYRPLPQLVPAGWQQDTLTMRDGARVHYTRTGGSKPAVVLLHGIQGAGLMWLRVARALEADYDVVMPDFRAHGQSSRSAEHGFTIDLLVQDMIELMGALELDTPLVIGHSMGADIAGRLAAAHPLRGVALVDPALQSFAPPMGDDGIPPWMEAIFQTMRALKDLPHEERLTAAQRLLPPGTPLWDEADYVSFVEAQAQFDLEAYRYAMAMPYLFAEPETIQRIECPALLLTARPMMPGMDIAPGVAAFMDHLRAGRHLHFEDSGHFIMYDQFEKFISAVEAFARG